MSTSAETTARLEYLRGEIRAERISYGELAELQDLSEHIESGDTELLEWAGVPEFPGEVDEPVSYAATAGNNRRVHLVRETHDDHNLTLCGVRTPRRPQTTQDPLPKCRRCF